MAEEAVHIEDRRPDQEDGGAEGHEISGEEQLEWGLVGHLVGTLTHVDPHVVRELAQDVYGVGPEIFGLTQNDGQVPRLRQSHAIGELRQREIKRAQLRLSMHDLELIGQKGEGAVKFLRHALQAVQNVQAGAKTEDEHVDRRRQRPFNPVLA